MKHFLRKCQHPMLLASGTYPLFVMLTVRILPDAVTLLPLLGLAYLPLAWGCLLAPGRWRIPAATLGGLLLFAVGKTLLPTQEAFALFLLPAGYTVLLFAVLPIAGQPREAELPPAWYVIGLIAHLLAQIVTDYARRLHSSLYAPAEGTLLFVFLVFLMLTMLALNRISLEEASQSRVKIPVQMRRQNLFLTLGLLCVAVLVAALPAIGAFLRRLWDSAVSGIAAIAGFFASLLSRSSGGAAPADEGGLTGFGASETVEPGLVQLILEKVIGIIALLAAAALIFFLARKLAKVLHRLFQWLWQKLAVFGNAAARDYEDEITDTRDDAQYERAGLLKRIQKLGHRPDTSRMSPNQRVRYRYLRLRMKHTDWQDASTARENLSPATAQIYERARYAGKALTDTEAQQFFEDTQRIE